MNSGINQTVEFICRCLTPVELANDVWESEEDIGKRDWDWIVRFMDASYLSPALTSGLKRHGLFSLLDARLQDYFEGIHALSVARNQRLRAQAIELIGLLNQADIEPLLLKGVAGLLDGLYEDDGERMMSDIDVLVGADGLPQAAEVLLDNGYRYYTEPTRYSLDMTYKHHAPGLVADEWPASVELHIRPTTLAGRRTLLDSEYAQRAARTVEIDGARALIPGAEFRLLHNFFHSQHQDGRNYRFGRLHIRGLLDWVKLRQALDAELDWPTVAQRVKQFHLQRSFSACLFNAQEYFNQPVPQGLKLDQLARIHCRRQRVLMRSRTLGRLNNLSLHLLQSGWNLFSPGIARKQYGDVSKLTVLKLRAVLLMSPSWRKAKYEDMRRVVG